MDQFLQPPFSSGFNDNIYHKGNISTMPDLDVFPLLEFKTLDLVVTKKMGTLGATFVLKNA